MDSWSGGSYNGMLLCVVVLHVGCGNGRFAEDLGRKEFTRRRGDVTVKFTNATSDIFNTLKDSS